MQADPFRRMLFEAIRDQISEHDRARGTTNRKDSPTMAVATKEAQSKAVERLMATLREIGGEIHGDDTIARHTSPKIVLPE